MKKIKYIKDAKPREIHDGFGVINKGFSDAGASDDKKAFKRFKSKSGSANEDIHYNLQKLRERSRTLSMRGGLSLSALKSCRTNVIGCGLIFKSRVDKDVLGLSDEEALAWQNNTEREFALWAENKKSCDTAGVIDFYKMQQLVFYSSLMSGDCCTLIQRSDNTDKMHPYSLRLNVIEADRVSTPSGYGSGTCRITDGKNNKNHNKIFDGVEVNNSGGVEAYYICNKHKNETNSDTYKWTRVEAYGKSTGLPNVLMTMSDIERPGQLRGLPILSPVVEMLLQIERYTEAELMAALVESLFTAFVQTESRQDENPLTEVVTDGDPDDLDETQALDESEYALGSGNIVHLAKGESVNFGDPKRPSGGFTAFVEMAANLIGSALEIPKEILLKEFKASYSASRAALLEFWKAVKMRREWFVSDFCRPILEIWMYEAVARGRINAPGFFDDPIIRQAWLGADFIGPSQGMLDPTKEITAEQMMCENGFSSRSDSAIRLNGSEYYRNIDALISENHALGQANYVAPSEVERVNKTMKRLYQEQGAKSDNQ